MNFRRKRGSGQHPGVTKRFLGPDAIPFFGRFVLIAVLVFLVAGVVLMKSLRGPLTAGEFYHQQLTELQRQTSTLAATFETSPAGNPTENLDRYLTHISDMIVPCRQITGKAPFYNGQNISQAQKDSITQADRLCRDLLEVLDYTQLLYKSCHGYISFGLSWPAVSDPAYQTNLRNLRGLIQSTQARLTELESSTVKDPALQELITQLHEADSRAARVETLLTDQNYTSASGESDTLIDQINQDKIDFLSARSYFWNNTIQLDGLKKAVTKLAEQFPAKDKAH